MASFKKVKVLPTYKDRLEEMHRDLFQRMLPERLKLKYPSCAVYLIRNYGTKEEINDLFSLDRQYPFADVIDYHAFEVFQELMYDKNADETEYRTNIIEHYSEDKIMFLRRYASKILRNHLGIPPIS